MTDVNIFIRTADQKRKADVTLSGSQTGGDVIQAAVDNWSLPKDADYSLVNTRTATPIQRDGSLDSQDVKNGDVLEVQPVADTVPSMRWTDKSQSTPSAPTADRVSVTCPNCKANLRLSPRKIGVMSCPFCNKIISSAA